MHLIHCIYPKKQHVVYFIYCKKYLFLLHVATCKIHNEWIWWLMTKLNKFFFFFLYPFRYLSDNNKEKWITSKSMITFLYFFFLCNVFHNEVKSKACSHAFTNTMILWKIVFFFFFSCMESWEIAWSRIYHFQTSNSSDACGGTVCVFSNCSAAVTKGSKK